MKKNVPTSVLKTLACAYFITPVSASNTISVASPPFGHGNKYPQILGGECIKKGGEILSLSDAHSYCVFSKKDYHDAFEACARNLNGGGHAQRTCAATRSPGPGPRQLEVEPAAASPAMPAPTRKN